METARTHRKLETKEMTVTEFKLKSLLLRKKKTGRHLERAELNWLCRAIWRKRRALKREKHLTKIKESAEMEKAPKKTQSKHFNWSSMAKHEKHRICSHKLLPRPGGNNPIRETSLGRAVEKLESGVCRRNADFAKETGKSLEEVEKRERLTGSDHSRCFESIASRMFGETGEIAVDDVLGNDFPGRLAVLFDGNGSESGGCNVFDQVQTDCWIVCDAASLGLRMAQVTSSTEVRERANCVCAEDACRCWTVSAVASGRVVERMAERNCGSAIRREESVRPCGPSSGLQVNEAARCESVLDGFDCSNLEWKLYGKRAWRRFRRTLFG